MIKKSFFQNILFTNIFILLVKAQYPLYGNLFQGTNDIYNEGNAYPYSWLINHGYTGYPFNKMHSHPTINGFPTSIYGTSLGQSNFYTTSYNNIPLINRLAGNNIYPLTINSIYGSFPLMSRYSTGSFFNRMQESQKI